MNILQKELFPFKMKLCAHNPTHLIEPAESVVGYVQIDSRNMTADRHHGIPDAVKQPRGNIRCREQMLVKGSHEGVY